MFPLFAAREERIQIHVGDPARFLLRVCHLLMASKRDLYILPYQSLCDSQSLFDAGQNSDYPY
jgi:hypothetical protein